MLNSAELSFMRTALNDLLPGTCVISTLSQASDGQGGFTNTWTASGTVNCRVDSIAGNMPGVGGGIQPFQQTWITMPQTATITTANRITCNGVNYKVLSINSDQSWTVCWRVKVDVV